MAAGDFSVYDAFLLNLGNKIHDMDGDTFKLAFVTASTTPDKTSAVPHFGGTGTTDLSINQTSGGNVAAGGVTLDSPTWTVAGSILKWSVDDEVIATNASNPSAARWGIVYNSSDANKRCVGFLDLGSARDMTVGTFTWDVAANGVFRIGLGTIS